MTFTRENGLQTKEKGMGYLPGVTRTTTLVCGRTIRNKARVPMFEKMVITMLVNGLKIE